MMKRSTVQRERERQRECVCVRYVWIRLHCLARMDNGQSLFLARGAAACRIMRISTDPASILIEAHVAVWTLVVVVIKTFINHAFVNSSCLSVYRI